jgi:hypothetical protein
LITGVFYLYINSTINPVNTWPALKFSANDSDTYINVGKWLLHEKKFSDAEMSIATRPFLYPLTVAVLEKIHPWAIIFFQYILWQSQIIIIFYCAKLISNSVRISFILALCSASVLSPIAISLHVLTETPASFLLTLSVFLLIKFMGDRHHSNLLFLYLLSLSLCAVIRPSYFYIFLLNIPFCFIIWKNKNIKGVLIALLILVPILFQFSIMKKNFNIYKLSIIYTLTVNDYFLSALELYKRNLEQNTDSIKMMVLIREMRRKSLAEIIDKEGYKNARHRIKIELFQNIIKFPAESIALFTDYIQVNSQQGSAYVSSKYNKKSNLFLAISYWQSVFFKYLNMFSIVIFIAILLTTLSKAFTSVLPAHFLPINFAVGTLVIFSYVSSGVSGFQGDRFVMPVFFVSLLWFFYQLYALKFFYRSVE